MHVWTETCVLQKSVKSIRHRRENGVDILKFQHDNLSKPFKKTLHWCNLLIRCRILGFKNDARYLQDSSRLHSSCWTKWSNLVWSNCCHDGTKLELTSVIGNIFHT